MGNRVRTGGLEGAQRMTALQRNRSAPWPKKDLKLENRRTWCTAGLRHHGDPRQGCSDGKEGRHLSVQFTDETTDLLNYQIPVQGILRR